MINYKHFFIPGFDPESGTPDAELWQRIRHWRDSGLTDSDWTQVIDAPVNQAAWATYRQELRDLPDSAALADLVFPVAHA